MRVLHQRIQVHVMALRLSIVLPPIVQMKVRGLGAVALLKFGLTMGSNVVNAPTMENKVLRVRAMLFFGQALTGQQACQACPSHCSEVKNQLASSTHAHNARA
jgi:hypothetical protein